MSTMPKSSSKSPKSWTEHIAPYALADVRAAYPLAGSELPYAEWVARFAPGAANQPFADFHHDLWRWGAGLEPGVKPDAFVGCWFRGAGKSTTIELLLAYLAGRARRRFALYVSATQASANRHVQATATTMERIGVERALTPYGHSRGWTAELLRTANGFNVLSLGIDAAVRGIKLDEFRPDVILFDDIDELGDGVEAVRSKVEVLTQSVIQAGSSDVAIAFLQNAIHTHSIMSGILSGRMDLLRRRFVSGPIPAVRDLVWEKGIVASGREEYRIVGGTAVWEGKPISVCEAEVNDTGLVSFLRECQHDVAVGGQFFADWDEDRHVVFEVDISIERTGTFFGGYDWGYGAPCAFMLSHVDAAGAVIVIDEVYQRGLTNPEQAEAVVEAIRRWNVPLDRVAVYADPSMWALKTDHTGRKVADVEAFHRAGLRFVKASNNRRGGWQNVRRYLRETVGPSPPGPLSPLSLRLQVGRGGEERIAQIPALRVLRGRCSNLIRTFPLQVFDPTDVEDLDTEGEDHAVDALRYALSSRPRPNAASTATDPAAPPPPGVPDTRPEWMKRKRAEKKRKL